MTNEFIFHSIATVRSCYKEKFGIPRQSGLSDSAKSIIEFNAPYTNEEFIRELESFSHIWVVFVFHQHLGKDIKPTVRPPRLGGNKKIGVFASRSPFRPNPVGLSVVRLEKITRDNNRIQLHVISADLLDGTPVIDIKPYIGYADAINDSVDGYVDAKPEHHLEVVFSSQANSKLEKILNDDPALQSLITETLSLDPRPAYADDDTKEYAMRLNDVDVRWVVKEGRVKVLDIEELK